jgi:hypothetical protein
LHSVQRATWHASSLSASRISTQWGQIRRIAHRGRRGLVGVIMPLVARLAPTRLL